jgi:hypothetical protein
MDDFWAEIEAQCAEMRQARSADEVIVILNRYGSPSSGDAFFAGGGGDTRVSECLREAGWDTVWYDAHYYWVMEAPDGSLLTYIEGDVYKGDVVKSSKEPLS